MFDKTLEVVKEMVEENLTHFIIMKCFIDLQYLRDLRDTVFWGGEREVY